MELLSCWFLFCSVLRCFLLRLLLAFCAAVGFCIFFFLGEEYGTHPMVGLFLFLCSFANSSWFLCPLWASGGCCGFCFSFEVHAAESSSMLLSTAKELMDISGSHMRERPASYP